MARKNAGGVNRSQLIRDYKKADAEIGPKAISEVMLADHGIKVSPQYVSTVLATAKKRSGKVGPGRRPGRAAGRAGSLDHKKLVKAKELMALMGGAAEAKAAIALIERLLK